MVLIIVIQIFLFDINPLLADCKVITSIAI